MIKNPNRNCYIFFVIFMHILLIAVTGVGILELAIGLFPVGHLGEQTLKYRRRKISKFSLHNLAILKSTQNKVSSIPRRMEASPTKMDPPPTKMDPPTNKMESSNHTQH